MTLTRRQRIERAIGGLPRWIAYPLILALTGIFSLAVAAVLVLVGIRPAAAVEDWTPTHSKQLAAYLVLHAADWSQTRYIAKTPGKHQEFNPLLGRHPEVDQVDRFFLITGVGYVFLVQALPARWRNGFQNFAIGYRFSAVERNYQAGIKFDF